MNVRVEFVKVSLELLYQKLITGEIVSHGNFAIFIAFIEYAGVKCDIVKYIGVTGGLSATKVLHG